MKAPACRVKDAVFDPAATVTEAGTESRVLVLDSETLAPPESAFFVSVTVQVAEAEGARVAGVQDTAETRTGATRLTAAVLETPLRVAVRVTD